MSKKHHNFNKLSKCAWCEATFVHRGGGHHVQSDHPDEYSIGKATHGELAAVADWPEVVEATKAWRAEYARQVREDRAEAATTAAPGKPETLKPKRHETYAAIKALTATLGNEEVVVLFADIVRERFAKISDVMKTFRM